MARNLADRVAIVTGGAKGIGYAIARSLGQAGAKVMLADWDKPAVEEAASSLSKDGIQATCTQCDVSNSQQVTELVARTATEMGGVDIMVANAGTSIHLFPGNLMQSSPGQIIYFLQQHYMQTADYVGLLLTPDKAQSALLLLFKVANSTSSMAVLIQEVLSNTLQMHHMVSSLLV
jgi:NAD(P)-dependent dehydrogenase (short-subunit alcohol dehydrogenase family)